MQRRVTVERNALHHGWAVRLPSRLLQASKCEARASDDPLNLGFGEVPALCTYCSVQTLLNTLASPVGMCIVMALGVRPQLLNHVDADRVALRSFLFAPFPNISVAFLSDKQLGLSAWHRTCDLTRKVRRDIGGHDDDFETLSLS